MKTSNIIVLSVFLSIMIGTTLLVFVSLSEAGYGLTSSDKENFMVYNKKSQSFSLLTDVKPDKKETLQDFKTLIIKGKGTIKLTNKDNENYIYKHQANTLTQKQDTLIINLKTPFVTLNYTDIKDIVISDSVYVNCDVLTGDVVNISATDKSILRIKNLDLNKVNIKAMLNSRVKIRSIAPREPKVYLKGLVFTQRNLKIKNRDNANIEITQITKTKSN